MPITIATNADTHFTLTNGQALLVPEDVNVVAQSSIPAIQFATGAAFTRVDIEGGVFSQVTHALYVPGLSSSFSQYGIDISTTGRLVSFDADGAFIEYAGLGTLSNQGEIQGARGLYLRNTDEFDIFNSGLIEGDRASALLLVNTTDVDIVNLGTVQGGVGLQFVNADNTQVFNSGTILGANNTNAYGVWINSGSLRPVITNAGTIYGSTGVVSDASLTILRNSGEVLGSNGAGISGSATATFAIENSGRIAGGNGGINLPNAGASVVNSGVIEGLVDENASAAITIGGAGNFGAYIQNTGTIRGLADAITLGGFDDRINNSGLIEGDVEMGLGDDVYQGLFGRTFGQVAGGAGEDFLLGGDHADDLAGDGDHDDLRGRGGDDTLYGGTGNDVLRGGEGNDLLIGGTSLSLTGIADDDLIQGGTGRDTIEGGIGQDVLYGQGGDDELDGGQGSDRLFGGNGNDLLAGNIGADTLQGGLANDTLLGDAGADELWGQGGEDSLSGGDMSDRLFGGGLGDTLDGGSGFDYLNGGRGDDILLGGPGNDTLTGGRGDDELTGDIGADVFVFGWINGDDVITDFQNTFDRIDLSLLDVALPDVMAAVSAIGSSAVLLDLNQLGASGTVLIDGVPLAGIGGGDFIL